MKRILVFLILAAMLLCGCTNTAVKNDNGSDNSISESTSAVTEETLPSGSEPAKTDEIVSVQEESAEVSTNTTSSESEKTAFPAPSELQNRPDGKEVSIFKDNTFDCDYSGYKEIGYDFGDLRFSVKAPETWNSFRFYGEDEIYQNIFIGFPLYDDPLDVKIVTSDDSTKFANDPLNKSTFFLAWTLRGVGLEDSLSSYTDLTKYDYETYVDHKERSMKVYFLDGLPELAVYDDFFNRCIVFNLENEDQIPIVVNMINSIEVSLSSDAMFALQTAERLGYTIIPPEE